MTNFVQNKILFLILLRLLHQDIFYVFIIFDCFFISNSDYIVNLSKVIK